ncbi:hypothetical protein MYSI104531_20395 [Mycobacterium simiae]
MASLRQPMLAHCDSPPKRASAPSMPDSRWWLRSSRTDWKRATGKRHNQVLLVLARRRVNVSWVPVHDQSTCEPVALKIA